MSLRDGFSGKISARNETVKSAWTNLGHGLNRYSLNNDANNPFTMCMRDHAFAFWHSTVQTTASGLDGPLARFKNNFYAIKPHHLLRYVSSLHFAHLITFGKGEDIMYAMIDAVGEIYSEPKAVAEHWKHIATAPDETGTLLMQVRGNFVADAIGDAHNSLPDAMFWRQLSTVIADGVKAAMAHDTWNHVVDEEIRMAIAA